MTIRINVITPFYKDSDFLRELELREALSRNIGNAEIGRIFALVEEGAEGAAILRDPKITAISVARGRQTYADLARVANEHCAGEIVVFANTDIYFDETISYVRTLQDRSALFVSTRREVRPEERSDWTINQQSSDAWAMVAPISAHGLDIQLGKMGCESLFLGRMLRAGYPIDNVSLDWKCYHLHATQKRNYDPKVDRYTEEMEMAFPLFSGRTPDRTSVRPTDGPIVVDGVAFSTNGSTHLWQELLGEWQRTPRRDDIVVLNRGGLDPYNFQLTHSDAPPFNHCLVSSVREINGTLARRLGASVFVSTGYTTALGVPSVVVATSASPEILEANLDLRIFQRGLSFQLADAVLCAGDDIRIALEHRYQHIGPKRFHTCPLWFGSDKVFGCMPAPERAFARARLGYRERYVIVAGERVTDDQTTNLRVVADAVRRLGNLGVVFLGGDATVEPEIRALFEGVSWYHLAEDSERTLLTLAAAEAFILPALAGSETDWTHLSLATGCPVVRARWSPQHVDGDGTVFFTPAAVDNLTEALSGILKGARDTLGEMAAGRARRESLVSNAQRIGAFVDAIRRGSPMPTVGEFTRSVSMPSVVVASSPAQPLDASPAKTLT